MYVASCEQVGCFEGGMNVIFRFAEYSSYIFVADEFHCTVVVAAGYPVVPCLCLKNYQIVFADGARDGLISFVELIIISSKFVLAFGIAGWLMNGDSKCIVIIIIGIVINNLFAGRHMQTFWFQHSPSFGWGSLIWLYFVIIVFLNAQASLVMSYWRFLFLQLSE